MSELVVRQGGVASAQAGMVIDAEYVVTSDRQRVDPATKAILAVSGVLMGATGIAAVFSMTGVI